MRRLAILFSLILINSTAYAILLPQIPSLDRGSTYQGINGSPIIYDTQRLIISPDSALVDNSDGTATLDLPQAISEDALILDQSTPQHVTGGYPRFDAGVGIVGNYGLYWRNLADDTTTAYLSYDGNLTLRAVTGDVTVNAGGGDIELTGDTNVTGDLSVTGTLSGYLKSDGTVTGATSQAQVFTNGITLSNLTASKVVFTDANQKLTSTGIGTSSQFIKGDGSLDSSTYLTSESSFTSWYNSGSPTLTALTLGLGTGNTISLTFDGLTSDGVITWHGDTGLFSMACDLDVDGSVASTAITELTEWVGPMAVDSSGNVWGVFTTGLKKSTDKGQTFTASDTIAQGANLSSQKFVFVASNGYIYWCQDGTGLLRRSVDGGANWTTELTFTADNRGIWGFSEDTSGGTYDGYLYAGIYTAAGTDDDNIYRSTDNGDTWASCYSSTNHHIHNVKADPYTGYVYACTGDGTGEDNIIRSVDGGANWTVLDSNKRCIAIGFFNGVRVFGDDLDGKVYITTDDSTFTQVYDDPDGGGDMGWWGGATCGNRLYFIGINLTTNDIPKIISSSDGTTWSVDYRGDNRVYSEGYWWISNEGPKGEIYVSAVGSDPSLRIIGGADVSTRAITSYGDIRLTPGSSKVLVEGNLGLSGDLTVGGNDIFSSGKLSITPAGNNLTLVNSHLTLQNGYYLKYTGTGNYWIATYNNDTDTGWKWETTYDVLSYYDNNTAIFSLDGSAVFSKKPLMIGGYSTNSLFWTSSNGSGSTTMYIGNATINVTASDERMKKNITDSELNALGLIGKFDVKDFDWKDNPEWSKRGRWTGMIAQDVYKVYPQIVNKPDNPDDMWAIEYQNLVPVLVKAVQEQQKEIDTLKARLDKLEQGE